MHDAQKKPLTISDLKQAALASSQQRETADRVHRIEEEFANGFDFISKLPKTVTIYGSTRANENNKHYQKARALASQLVHDSGFGVVTGGGPGIMEAANRGAKEAGGVSAGITVQLPEGQKVNDYINRHFDCHYFFTRKVILSFAARMYIFFPGGYGTLDEFFEIITLVQTNKIQSVPIICVGADFWSPLEKWMNDHLLIQNEAIDESDLGLFTITDNDTMVAEIAQYAEARV